MKSLKFQAKEINDLKQFPFKTCIPNLNMKITKKTNGFFSVGS